MIQILIGAVFAAAVWGLGTESGRAVFHKLYLTSSNTLAPKFRSYFPKHSVLILGEKQSGKTSLISFLQNERPYRLLADGTKEMPEPTFGLVILPESRMKMGNDKINQWVKIAKDVAGDAIAQADLWPKMIADIDPNGIIYMVEGSTSEEVIQRQFKTMAESVLSHYMAGSRSLKTIFVFLNYMDMWVNDRSDKIDLQIKWSSLLNVYLRNHMPGLRHIELNAVSTQLNPNKNSWPEAEIALAQFAAALSHG